MADVTKNIEYIVTVIDNASAHFNKIGLAATAVGLAVTASLGVAVNSAIAFESSFAGVRKTVDASEAEFAALERNFRNLSKQVPVNVNQLNRIGELAGQLGVRGVENLTNFTKSIAELSVTTDLTEESAATAFARISNITQEPISNIDRMGSSVVELGNNFATTESEITEFALRIAGAGKIAGLTTAEIFGIAAAFSSAGIQAETGGTAVQKILLDLNNQGKRGIGEFEGFVRRLADSGNEAGQVLTELGFADSRLQRAFLSVAGAGGVLEDAVRSSTDAFRENTALAEEAAKRFATTESQWIVFKNTVNDLAIVIASLLLPAINKILLTITPVISKMAEWAEAHPKISQSIALVVAALGILLTVAGSALVMFTTIVSVLASVKVAMAAIGIAAGVLAPLLALGGPLALAIVGLIALLITLAQHWEAVKWKAQLFAETLVENTKMWVEIVTLYYQSFFDTVKNIFDSMSIEIQLSWQSFLDVIKNSADSALNAIKGAFSGFFGWLLESLQTAWEKAKEIAEFVAAAATGSRSSRGRSSGGVIAEPFTRVGEHGPEIISAPQGSRVHTAQESRGMMGKQVHVEVNVHGGMIGVSSREIVDALGAMVMRQLNLTTNHA
jgi:TP901 family phage tail tape measure protein